MSTLSSIALVSHLGVLYIYSVPAALIIYCNQMHRTKRRLEPVSRYDVHRINRVVVLPMVEVFEALYVFKRQKDCWICVVAIHIVNDICVFSKSM